MYETHLRELDPQLGRWWQVDPVFANGVDGNDEANGIIIEGLKSQSPYASMDNNPIRFDDPDGGCTPCLVEMAEAWEAAAASGAWGTAATTVSSESSGSTMGPGEAMVAATGAFFGGAWHGMQRAWNSVSESMSADPGMTVSGAGTFITPHSELLSEIMPSRPAPTPSATLDVSKQVHAPLNLPADTKRVQANKTGTIYKVPGSATKSGKPYIGRHNKPNPAKTRKSNDGRDRKKAKVIDTYDPNDVDEGRKKEQKAIDQSGGG
jgi:hypothetical protein